MFHRTDVGKIQYPKNITAQDRQLCRRMICKVSSTLQISDLGIISCSGGIDSTVLAHAASQALRIHPTNNFNQKIEVTAVYLNHHLRPDEVDKEDLHVAELSKQLTFVTPSISLNVTAGSGLQMRARSARYAALKDLAKNNLLKKQNSIVVVLMAHNANDVAETKIGQFVSGRPVTGIPIFRELDDSGDKIYISRPLLQFSRKEIERYATAFNLSWCEDSSNKKTVYTRNIIRQKVIPLFTEINPGLIKMLSV